LLGEGGGGTQRVRSGISTDHHIQWSPTHDTTIALQDTPRSKSANLSKRRVSEARGEGGGRERERNR
jgi:hypothetical protein